MIPPGPMRGIVRRIVAIAAVLWTAGAFGGADAAVCGLERCVSQCVAVAGGRCIRYRADPRCLARRQACQSSAQSRPLWKTGVPRWRYAPVRASLPPPVATSRPTASAPGPALGHAAGGPRFEANPAGATVPKGGGTPSGGLPKFHAGPAGGGNPTMATSPSGATAHPGGRFLSPVSPSPPAPSGSGPAAGNGASGPSAPPSGGLPPPRVGAPANAANTANASNPIVPLSPVAPPSPFEQLIPARAYLRAADIPPPGVAAYGVVALRATPTSATRARLRRVCAAFTAHLPRQSSLPSTVRLADQMLTIWPLDQPEADAAKADDCNFMLDHYDLYGGISAIEDAERQGGALNGIGPFLIGWSPSTTRGVPDKVVLVIDMSSFESQDSIDEAFLLWQKRIVQNPALWRAGFSMEGIRLAVRDFVDHYGQDVIKVFGFARR